MSRLTDERLNTIRHTLAYLRGSRRPETVPANMAEDLLAEIERLRAANAALLEACRAAADNLERFQETFLLEGTNEYLDINVTKKQLRAAIQAGEEVER